MVSALAPTVGLATCADLPCGDEDGELILEALADVGVRGAWLAWDDPATNWDTLALVVVRSTWDYTSRREDFLALTSAMSRLANQHAAIAWNSDKRYLTEVAEAGIATVPTLHIEPGEGFELPPGEIVVKPSVGAGSLGAGRFSPDAVVEASNHVHALHSAGRTVLVQPYLSDVDTAGETALLYFNGAFSHAARKGALLPAGTVHGIESTSLFVHESISAAEATQAELAVGDRVMRFLRNRFGSDLLYARVDLLPTPAGPVVLELELIEPSLFLAHSDGAPARFAAAAAAVLGALDSPNTRP